MANEEKDKKVIELQERINKIESILALHYHNAMGSAGIGMISAVCFKSLLFHFYFSLTD